MHCSMSRRSSAPSMLVLAAVQQNGHTLQHASQELHASKAVCDRAAGKICIAACLEGAPRRPCSFWRPCSRMDIHCSMPRRSSAPTKSFCRPCSRQDNSPKGVLYNQALRYEASTTIVDSGALAGKNGKKTGRSHDHEILLAAVQQNSRALADTSCAALQTCVGACKCGDKACLTKCAFKSPIAEALSRYLSGNCPRSAPLP